ncbi:MAG: cyclic nucleotide-binding domain-containing protein, partial [Kiloniellaceae bacterium]
YQLDDPEEYEAETIVVIGAGDAAIENAVALVKQNDVVIVNRKDEFARAKDGNRALIMDAIQKGALSCMYSADIVRLDPGSATFETPDGEVTVACDRVIARLGAIAPRKFVESCGIEFPSADPTSLPEASSTYESNVPGLYIIGALAGYPLIKQAMNQGYEVIEFILGNDIKPADEPLLEERFKVLGDVTVKQVLDTILPNIPIFSDLPPLVVREMMLEATIHRPAPSEVIFERNDYTNSFYAIVDGEVDIEVDPADPSRNVVLGQGDFFGEIGLIAGRRRSATVRARTECILLEVPRRTMIKMVNSFDEVRRRFDRAAIARQIMTHIAPNISAEDLAEVVQSASIRKFKRDEALFAEGHQADGVHLIRRGSVTVSRRIGGKETVLSYVAAGCYVGEMALLTDASRMATVRAAVATETVRIENDAFKRLLDNAPDLRGRIEAQYRERLIQNERMEQAGDAGNLIQFLVEQGLGEATDVLLIDESLCTRCNNCEAACADTHGGVSRLNREAGPTFANVHVPTSCRHCEHPHCMADCPPDAIHRAPNGEVFIDESCIGCGNCKRNCPYDVIQMAAMPPPRRGLL